MKKITVNFCGNCPFLYSSYDDYAVGCSTTDECTLSRFLNQDEYFIDVHDGLDFNSETPLWCPLRKEEYSFGFQEFNLVKTEEIDLIKKEIDELGNFFDSLHDESYDSSIINEKSRRLQELYNILADLQSSQIEDDLTIENFQKEMDEVQKKVKFLEEAGSKLQALINNLEEE
jgi:hypothetical protein